MVADDLQKQLIELRDSYWEGPENKIIRWWTYLNVGLDVFNQFKYYLGLPILAGAVFPFLKGHQILLGVVLIIGIPILVVAGRYQIQKVRKVTQVINILNDVFQAKPMEMSIEQVNILKEIRDNLKLLNDKNIK